MFFFNSVYLIQEKPNADLCISVRTVQMFTWSRAGGGASVQSNIWLSRALWLWVVARHLLWLGLWHRHAVLSTTVWGRGGHQQRLLGGGGGRR